MSVKILPVNESSPHIVCLMIEKATKVNSMDKNWEVSVVHKKSSMIKLKKPSLCPHLKVVGTPSFIIEPWHEISNNVTF